MLVSIIPFEARFASSFKDLNLAWLKKYFYVEPQDEILLENCQESIIDTGGFIFFAKSGAQIVGCFAFIKKKDDEFELGKMAVLEGYQGQKIGQQLMQFAIAFAKERKWHKLSLYSSSKLPAALHIYRKYGFNHIALEENLPYLRSDVKMELDLRKESKNQ